MTAFNPAAERKAEAEAAAKRQHANHLAALREELGDLERTRGKDDDRAKAVRAELARVEKLGAKADAVSDDPAPTVDEKQRQADAEREQREAEERSAEEAAKQRAAAAAKDDEQGKRAAATSRPRGRAAKSTSTAKG